MKFIIKDCIKRTITETGDIIRANLIFEVVQIKHSIFQLLNALYSTIHSQHNQIVEIDMSYAVIYFKAIRKKIKMYKLPPEIKEYITIN